MESKYRFFEDAHWLRLLLMALYWLVMPFLQFLLGVITVIQGLAALITGEPIPSLQRFGGQLANFVAQILQFLVYKSDQRPFPFTDWPSQD
jgi:hypothetical protein